MAELDKQGTVTLEELIVSILAITELSKLLIDKRLIAEAAVQEKANGRRRIKRH